MRLNRSLVSFASRLKSTYKDTTKYGGGARRTPWQKGDPVHKERLKTDVD
jgi:hypothetical protein